MNEIAAFTTHLSSSISPRASTWMFLDKSPKATAFVVVAMERIWFVRFPTQIFSASSGCCQSPSRFSACKPQVLTPHQREAIVVEDAYVLVEAIKHASDPLYQSSRLSRLETRVMSTSLLICMDLLFG